MIPDTSPQAIRRPRALAEVAFERLRADLVSRGPLTAGRRIVASELASELGMSRTPVREALDRLGRLGYLEPLDGGGYRRRRYRIRDIRDLHELRLLLEPVAAELAAAGRRQTPDPADSAFHAQVGHASGNRVLGHVVELLAERMSAARTDDAPAMQRWSRMRAGRDERVAHGAVADAIARGDGESARRAMAKHVASEARSHLTSGADDGAGHAGAPGA
jgi:DNA-binding GntR family transcriptional regulator